MPTDNMANTGANTATERVFTMERVFDAPRTLVFEAFTKPEHLKHWWGPKGWTLPVCEQDFRVGGVWFYCMRGPDGTEGCGKATYREIVPPERIVYTDAFADAAGNVIETMPQMTITVTFTEHDGKTKITNRVDFPTVEAYDATLAMGMVEGMGETWDRLEAFLKTAV